MQNTMSRRMLTTVAATTIALSFVGLSPAVAQTRNAVAAPAAAATASTCSATNASTSPSSTNMTQITGAAATTLVDRVTAGVRAGQFTAHAGADALNADQAKVYRVTSQGQTFTSVTVPVGGVYSLTSNLTVLFDASGTPLSYAETLYSRGSSGTFHLTKYANGTLGEDHDTELAYMSNAELAKAPAPSPGSDTFSAQATSGKSFGSKVACVSSVLGVSGAVGYLIVGACAGACAASETGVTIPVCVACIGAYAAFGGASVTAVASCFN